MNSDLLDFLGIESFVAIDVETTGLDKNKDKIIEVSAVKFINGVEQKSFSHLLNPKKPIPIFIENLTGISNNDVKDMPIFDSIAQEFLNFIGSSPIVGHNIGFDINFLNNELNSSSRSIKPKYICDTYILSRIFFYYFNSFKLESICAKLNINTGSSHRALDDARSSGFLFLKIISQMECCDLNTFHMLNKIIKEYDIYNSKLIQKFFQYRIENNVVVKCEHIEKSNFYIFTNNKATSKIDKVSDILGPDSILINKNSNFQYRENQLLFSESCSNTITNKSILIAEAGTGLGKSFGYLAPSILNIDEKNIVISTSTHNLQSQLLQKDIPDVSKKFNKNIKALIIKGQNNYLCYNKLYKLSNEITDLVDYDDINELLSLIFWSNNTISGDISECTSFDSKRNKKIWDLIKFDSNSCYSHNKKDDKCFYNNVIKESKNSNIFIVNHALLARNADNQDLAYNKASACIIDEAHNFIENSRSQLSSSLSYIDIRKDCDYFEKLFKKLNKEYDFNPNIVDLFNLFNKQSLDLIQKINDLSFSLINKKLESSKMLSGNYSLDFRILSAQHENEDSSYKINAIIEIFNKQIDFISSIKKELALFIGHEFNYNQKTQIINIENRYLKYCKIIKEFSIDNPDFIKWIKVFIKDSQIKLCVFNIAPFTIGETVNKICKNYDSLIFCSATLSIDGDFSSFVDDSSLDSCIIDKEIEFKSFPSSFFYQDQIKSFLYNCNEEVNSSSYIFKITDLLIDLKKQIKKRMLVLCTSYKQINDFQNILKTQNLNNVYFQSLTSSKENILKHYIENDGSILFGTSSFWEGIDLPNDLLEILVILKVPFENPNNPIVGSKIDFYNETGRNSFYEYQIPKAILKLKQGIGRLIRTDEDNGICILTDPRLVSKKYGNIILENLPSETIITTDKNLIIRKAETFLNH